MSCAWPCLASRERTPEMVLGPSAVTLSKAERLLPDGQAARALRTAATAVPRGRGGRAAVAAPGSVVVNAGPVVVSDALVLRSAAVGGL